MVYNKDAVIIIGFKWEVGEGMLDRLRFMLTLTGMRRHGIQQEKSRLSRHWEERVNLYRSSFHISITDNHVPAILVRLYMCNIRHLASMFILLTTVLNCVSL